MGAASCRVVHELVYPLDYAVVAAYLVVSMPLELLRWMVLVVVLYAAAIMLIAALRGRREHKAEPGTAAVAD